MQGGTLHILQKRFHPEDAQLLGLAIDEEIKGSKVVVEAVLDRKLAETEAKMIRWMFSAVAGQTALLTGIIYFMITHVH